MFAGLLRLFVELDLNSLSRNLGDDENFDGAGISTASEWFRCFHLSCPLTETIYSSSALCDGIISLGQEMLDADFFNVNSLSGDTCYV